MAAEPEPLGRELGLILGVMPVTKAVARRLIVPAKLLRESAWIVDVPDSPCSMVKTSGSDERLKSGPVTKIAILRKCTSEPLIPCIVTK